MIQIKRVEDSDEGNMGFGVTVNGDVKAKFFLAETLFTQCTSPHGLVNAVIRELQYTLSLVQDTEFAAKEKEILDRCRAAAAGGN